MRIFGAAVLAALTLFTVSSHPAAAPASVSAHCTYRWESTTTAPSYIRVWRTATGAIEKVPFRRYVEVVMSDEWPSHYPNAALQAAAVAVKQYGWYYTLHPRVRSDDRCYSVKDTTADQLYRPGRKIITDKHKAAVANTWGLTLRRDGKFFLTGYRSGTEWQCGGELASPRTRLYAKGTYTCAQHGWSRTSIQKLYYGRYVQFVWR